LYIKTTNTHQGVFKLSCLKTPFGHTTMTIQPIIGKSRELQARNAIYSIPIHSCCGSPRRLNVPPSLNYQSTMPHEYTRFCRHLQEHQNFLVGGNLRCTKKRYCLSAASLSFFRAVLANFQPLSYSIRRSPPQNTDPFRRDRLLTRTPTSVPTSPTVNNNNILFYCQIF